MQYYKLILDNTIIGVITSNNFIYYSPVAQCYLRCDETKGEYISYKGQLYRTTWMWPIVVQEDYIEVQVNKISESEYNVLKEIFEVKEEIEIEDDEEIPIPTPIEPEENPTLEFVRTAKIDEMSYFCHKTIEAGFDLAIRGETKHFSLTTQDQLNLMSLSITTQIQTQSLIPYHADGEECEFYTVEEINQIISEATTFKNYHLSYYNSLKTYINTLDTIEAIAAITYGTPVPDEYKSDVLKVLE